MSYFTNQEYQNRLHKLQELRRQGIEPYPHHFQPTHTVSDILKTYNDLPLQDSEGAARGEGHQAKIAGRLILFRAMGKNAFAHILDGNEKIQVMFNKDLTRCEGLNEQMPSLKFIEKMIDLGDFIGLEGYLFRTHKGEITLFVKTAQLLAKSLLSLPEKHSGIVDKEIRYRKRWLDLISHKEIKDTFIKRSRIIKALREFTESYGFMEVETPILQNMYGGAEARPFTTHINALDQEMYLRISLEISLKKLIIGGMERIYELGKVFRNEGIDKTHNPEFTMFEAYAAYWDYNDMMSFTEKLVEHISLTLLGDTKILYTHLEEPLLIDVKAPWKRITMKDSLKEYAGIDIDALSDEEMRRILEKETEIEKKSIQSMTRGLLIASLFSEKVEGKLLQPHHVIDHPIETTPLCKPHRDPLKRQEGLVERFESFVLGKELCNAYTELNDPEIQRSLLEKQVEKREQGDEEAHPLDEEFIEAMCQGMPPTGGVGIGIDRLVMLFTNSASIRDVLYFPIMRH